MAVQKKKPRVRVSKNRKKNWNKYCDIKEVEDFLEEKRFEERIGGAVADKTDAELFCIETDLQKKGYVKKKQKSLRCFQNIGAYSKVPPPNNRNQLPYSKKIKNCMTLADEKRWKRTRASTLKETKQDEKKMLAGDMFVSELKDLWNEKAEVDPEIEELLQFRDEYTKKRTPKIPGHRYQKPSLLPAVEIPHSGASYNPGFDEHQELMHKALKVEEAKEKEELHLKRVLTDMFPTKAEAPTEESILKEMSQGLFEVADSGEENDVESTYMPRNPPVSFEDRIPKSRKRRKKERKEQDRLKLLEKIQKKRLNEVYRIRSIKSEIKQEAVVTEGRVKRHLERKIDKMYKPKTLGKHKYEAPDVEVQMSGELCDSLRTLKTEGNLLEDRYKSLQRRNLIEPRIKQKMKRKYKLKVQVKRSHRNFK